MPRLSLSCTRAAASSVRALASLAPPRSQSMLKRKTTMSADESESTCAAALPFAASVQFPYVAHPHLDALAPPPFALTTAERALFETVLAACTATPELHNVTVRAAGGWVRDKLLGIQSHDIDLAVDRCSGARFAELLIAYVTTRLGVRASGVGVIKTNPDKSKHLETATFVLFGIDVDCVALRSETYADSRIPTIGACECDECCNDG